ncbi:MAG TPA: hypothetical protein VFO60_05155 [Candidatus Dormibacteraeota bacterium]|nr:hypothetical protein [Candidatus Dormibacteraeota bacterium]
MLASKTEPAPEARMSAFLRRLTIARGAAVALPVTIAAATLPLVTQGQAAAAGALVQSTTGYTAASATSVTATLAGTPRAGDLLVLVGNSDATMETPAGYTLAVSGVGNQAAYIWYRVAQPSEPASVTVALDADTSGEVVLQEWAGVGRADRTAANTTFSTVTTLSTGTTAVTSQASELVIAAAGLDNTNARPGWPTAFGSQWSLAGSGAGGSYTGSSLGVGARVLTAPAAQSASATWRGGAPGSAIIATFPIVATGGGSSSSSSSSSSSTSTATSTSSSRTSSTSTASSSSTSSTSSQTATQSSTTSSSRTSTATQTQTQSTQSSQTTQSSATSNVTTQASSSSSTSTGAAPPPASTTGCLARPSACGYPDATTTGVPAGVTLTPFTCPWALEWGACPVRTNNYVFQNMDDNGIGFDVYATGVVFKNMAIHDTPDGTLGIAFHDGASGVVTHSSISNVDKAVWGSNWTADHLNIWGTRGTAAVETNCDGSSACPLSTQRTTLSDSFIHTFACPVGQHCSGFRTFFNFANITATHNTILTDNTIANAGPYDAVNLTNENNAGPVTNWTIVNNLMDGGSWTVYLLQCHDEPGCTATSSGVTLQGNRLGVPEYGPILSDIPNAAFSCSGNVYDATGNPVTWQGLPCS